MLDFETYSSQGKTQPLHLNPDMCYTLVEVGVRPTGKSEQVNLKASLIESLGCNLTKGVFYFNSRSSSPPNHGKVDFKSKFKEIPTSMLEKSKLNKLIPKKFRRFPELEERIQNLDSQWIYDFITRGNKFTDFKGRDQLRGLLGEAFVLQQIQNLPYDLLSNVNIIPKSSRGFPVGYSTEIDALIEHEQNRQFAILKYFSRQKHLDTRVYSN
ncbi:MAG: hypothetical protein ACMXYB_00825 [Candidatus Woesearchaeota archaeon]